MRVVTASAKPLRVLGIDPGTHVVGWGVVERDGSRLVALGFGVVRAPASASIDLRLLAIAKGLREIVKTHRPDEGAVEEAFYGRDVRAAIRLGEGRGAALVVLAEAGVPVSSYANNVVKRAVSGSGRAGKTRVQAMTKAVLGLASLEGPFDASDALALAICHHHAGTLAGLSQTASRGASRSGSRLATGSAPAGKYAPRVEAAILAQRESDAKRRRRM